MLAPMPWRRGRPRLSRRLPRDGSPWLLRGEKWFCSVANADQMLVTARPVGAAHGTRGLGTFLVPRRLPDGSLNAFHIRRSKTKFGTRTMASAEIDFDDAVAFPIGPVDEGFKIVVESVLNTSRSGQRAGLGRAAAPGLCRGLDLCSAPPCLWRRNSTVSLGARSTGRDESRPLCDARLDAAAEQPDRTHGLGCGNRAGAGCT